MARLFPKKHILFNASFVMMIGFAVVVNSGRADAKGQGWVFEQRSEYYGRHTTVISESGCKLNSEKLGITLVTHGPDWEILVSNAKKREFLELTQQQWQKKMGGHHNREWQRYRWIKKVGEDTVAGLKADHYQALDDKMHDKSRKYRVLTSANKNQAFNSEIWVARDVKAPPQAASLTAGLGGLPMEMGFVLRIYQFKIPGQKLVALDTVKANHTKISPTEFTLPKGYKRVKDEFDLLMMDEGGADDAASLLLQESGISKDLLKGIGK